jgi:hypothetical protein
MKGRLQPQLEISRKKGGLERTLKTPSRWKTTPDGEIARVLAFDLKASKSLLTDKGVTKALKGQRHRGEEWWGGGGSTLETRRSCFSPILAPQDGEVKSSGARGISMGASGFSSTVILAPRMGYLG